MEGSRSAPIEVLSEFVCQNVREERGDGIADLSTARLQ